jgi:hypothetical protein
MVAAAAAKADAECVRVVVRCRPLNAKETADGRTRIVEMAKGQGQVLLRTKAEGAAGSDPPKAFTFDAVFDWESTQREVYENTAAGIVNSTLEGYNGTVFAYGQTGTGKTHTMEGQSADPSQQGIIPQAFDHIFKAIEASADTQYLVRASFLEIYNEEIRDLLSKSPKDKLELKEHKDSGVYVKGLNAFVVKSVPEIKNVLEVRIAQRASACLSGSVDDQNTAGWQRQQSWWWQQQWQHWQQSGEPPAAAAQPPPAAASATLHKNALLHICCNRLCWAPV